MKRAQYHLNVVYYNNYYYYLNWGQQNVIHIHFRRYVDTIFSIEDDKSGNFLRGDKSFRRLKRIKLCRTKSK